MHGKDERRRFDGRICCRCKRPASHSRAASLRRRPTGWTGLQRHGRKRRASRTWFSWKRSPVAAILMVPPASSRLPRGAGLLDIVGRSDARPLMLGGHQISYSTGLSGFLAAVSLLHDDDAGPRRNFGARNGAVDQLEVARGCSARAADTAPLGGKRQVAHSAMRRRHVALVYFDRDWPQIGKMTGDPAMLALSAERGWTDPDKLAELERGWRRWVLRQTREQIAGASKSFGLAFGRGLDTDRTARRSAISCARIFRDADGETGSAIRPRLPVIAAAQGPVGTARRDASACEQADRWQAYASSISAS